MLALVSVQSAIDFQRSLFTFTAAIDVRKENLNSKSGHNIVFLRIPHLPLAETKVTRLLYAVVEMRVYIKWSVSVREPGIKNNSFHSKRRPSES